MKENVPAGSGCDQTPEATEPNPLRPEQFEAFGGFDKLEFPGADGFEGIFPTGGIDEGVRTGERGGVEADFRQASIGQSGQVMGKDRFEDARDMRGPEIAMRSREFFASNDPCEAGSVTVFQA